MPSKVSHSGNVTGPYTADAAAYRLSGQGGWSRAGAPRAFDQALAAWSRNYDTYPAGALISQYMVMPHTADCGTQKSLAGGGHVWLLPFRRPYVDADDHLRWVFLVTTAPYPTALHCTALHRIALHCTMFCTVCTAPYHCSDDLILLLMC